MAEVGDIYPGTNERIVGVVYNPNGPGRWLQGERGGVFAEGGAPFMGSYLGLDPRHRNDPNRRFTGIVAEGGGYRSLTNTGEPGYFFGAPPPAAAPPPAPAAPTPQQERERFGQTPGGMSAKGELAAILSQYGLPATLADRLWDQEYIQKGTPIGTITSVVLPNTDEYRQRFPGLTALRERQSRGEAVVIPTVEQYVQLEAGIKSVMRDAGLPADFYDKPDDFAKWIGGSVSPKEVQDRIDYARTVGMSLPVAAREELNRVYDMDMGELTAFVLDPDRGMEAVQKRVAAVGFGGAAKQIGFGLLTREEMEQLAGAGQTQGAVTERFGTLTQMGEGLFAETAGETQTGEDLGRQTQIGFAGGSAEAERQMTSRRQRRAAAFEGGGGAATGGAGRTGLGGR